jgi:glycosyltransferase involved in cell wall biosynthesis
LENIQLNGFQEQSIVREDLCTTCALVFPSIGYESFGMSVIESFSLGVPVLINNNDSLGFVEENGITGYRFSIADPASLAIAIEHVRANQAVLKQNCLLTYKHNYTPQHNMQELERIYTLMRG